MTAARPHPGYIYVVQQGRRPLVKIGHSRDPVERRAALQAGAGGLEMRLLFLFVGSRAAEAALHARFAAQRRSGEGEWFDLAGDLRGWIAAIPLPSINPDLPVWRYDSSFAAPSAPAADLGDLQGAVEQWIADCCELAPARELASDLFRSFAQWAGQHGHDTPSQGAFGRDLRARGILYAGKDSKGRVTRRGVRLREGNGQ